MPGAPRPLFQPLSGGTRYKRGDWGGGAQLPGFHHEGSTAAELYHVPLTVQQVHCGQGAHGE